MSNTLDPDQAQHFVGPDLGPNCMQGLSVGYKTADSRQKVKYFGSAINSQHSTGPRLTVSLAISIKELAIPEIQNYSGIRMLLFMSS